MAEEIKLEITVDAQGAEQTLGSLKSKAESLKAEIENEPIGSKRFNELRNEIKKTEGQVNKLDDSLKALDPEQTADAFLKSAEGIAGGFAVVTGTMALFGTQSEEVEEALLKVQSALAIVQGIKAMTEGVKGLATAFNVLRTAILANPIGLIITGVVALAAGLVALIVYWDKVSLAIRNFTKNMSDGMKIAIAVMFPFIGAVMYLAGAFDKAALKADALAEAQRKAREASIEKSEEEIKRLNEESELIKKQESVVTKRYDTQLRLARAAGKDTYEIEVNRLKDLIKFSEQELAIRRRVAEEAANIYRSEFTKGFVKVYDEQAAIQKEKVEGLNLDLQVLQIEHNKKLSESKQEQLDLDYIAEEEASDFRIQLLEEENDVAAELLRKGTEQAIAEAELQAAEEKRIAEDKLAFEELMARRREALNQLVTDSITQSLDILTTVLENNEKRQLDAAEGNEAKQEQIRRKFFERNKKVQIAQALMTTYQSATAAFASQIIPMDPTSVIRGKIAAAFAIIAGLANVQKIRQTQFEGGSDSGGTAGGAPNFGGAPNINNQSVGSTTLNVSNTPPPTKVYVVESDITQAQKNVNGIVNKATID